MLKNLYLKNHIIKILFLTNILFLEINSKSFAKEFEKELSTIDITNSVLKHYPLILSQYEELSASRGRYLSSKGVFDITLKQEYLDYSRGFYDGKNLKTLFEKQNEAFGSKFYGGYRKSFNQFEDYNGDYQTNNNGELFAGIKISILEGRSTDKYRLGKILAEYNIEESKVHLQNIKIQIKRDAIKAYWNWISSYEIYKTYDEIYQLSLKRDSQLKSRFQKGDISKMVYVENRKNLLSRKNQTIEAKNLFEISAIYLSLFYRDESSKPIIPSEKQIPKTSLQLSNAEEIELDKDIEYALENRAEIQMLKIKKKSEEQNLKYAKNLLQPKLDLSFETSKDLGEGTAERAQSRNKVNLALVIPLQFSEARGEKLESTSKLNALGYELKITKEQINYELSQLQKNITSSLEIFNNSKEEVSLAKELELAEEQRFKLGDSDFFLVNLRELSWADAKIKQIISLQNYQNQLADYEAKVFKL